jgi:hypothetical protein
MAVHHYLFFYNEKTGAGTFGELKDGFKTVGRKIVFSFSRKTTRNKLTGEGYTGGFNRKEWVVLRHYPPNSFLKGWDHICPIGFVT